ncbi:hypothetical protein BGZ76_003534 [Entomortierella beljakovae]|nr:hypothetical protein BGZ76_003534 [Entomortierella beljakovae]
MSRNQQDQIALSQINTPSQQSQSVGSKFKSFFKKDNKKPAVVLSERDARILAQVKSRAKLLDTGINLGCAKVGLDPIIGLVPVAGDAITLALAFQLIFTAQKADIPNSLNRQMIFNVVIDFGMGLVPIVGDYCDFMFKANDRNAQLFEEYLYERAAKQAAEEAAKVQVATPPSAASSRPYANV